ncbi:MAG: DUF393 domain-containing protein [Campylobacteraceae bacterium]|nr:DUF393 domain-containing protein [Campylobacteraceae bacterium]
MPSLVLFDGVCNFCNKAVSFIIKRDPKEIFYFAAIQSPIAQKLLKEYKLNETDLDSVILIKDGHCYTKSDATLEITKDLKGFYSYLWVFKFLPKKFRDYFYDLFAKNRYKIFGKRNSCMIPSSNISKRFMKLSDIIP